MRSFQSAKVSHLRRAVTPPWLRGYEPRWLRFDLIAGVTLATVAIPEVMGYTTIA